MYTIHTICVYSAYIYKEEVDIYRGYIWNVGVWTSQIPRKKFFTHFQNTCYCPQLYIETNLYKGTYIPIDDNREGHNSEGTAASRRNR